MNEQAKKRRQKAAVSGVVGASGDTDSDPWLDHLQSETRSGSRSRIDPGLLSVPTLTLV